MFTNGMYERLSEWSANISVLFFGSAILPIFSNGQLSPRSLIFGGVLALFSLWLSLRLMRFSERREI
ncbi:MAG: hypothetical protein AAB550_03925 [Patescibacteria group bacterium]